MPLYGICRHELYPKKGKELPWCLPNSFVDHGLGPPADLIASESTSIPKNPRTDRPVGYAFVDLSTPSEAERAIQELSGKEILERKVSVQLARKPEPAAEKTDAATTENTSGGEGNRRRASGRGRGRGRGRGGRAGRGGRSVSSRHAISIRS